MKRLFTLIAFVVILISTVSAQSDNSAICKKGDCSPSVFTIQLDEPLQPSTPNIYSAERTENFKTAFQSFQEIKKTYALKKGWDEKRKESQLGGQNCARHYQLEAQFSYFSRIL